MTEVRNTFQSYNTFLSSPGDVQQERLVTDEVVRQINLKIRESLRVNFSLISWRDLTPVTPNPKETTIQEELNKLVQSSHCFILILHRRYGTIEPGHTKSNTEREMDTVLSEFKRKPNITILSYFKKLEDNKDPGPEEQKVLQFKKRLSEAGVFHYEFNTLEEFRVKLIHDMYNLAMKLKLSPFKSQCLNRFWNIETSPVPGAPDLNILYRPLNRLAIASKGREEYWHKRLMPAIAFEDVKAIQKIQKNIRTLGLRSKVYTNSEIPANWAAVNRLWVCAPRMPQAQAQLVKLGDRVKFRFEKRRNMEARLWWNYRVGECVLIQSPLSRYLAIQRATRDCAGEWNSRLPKVVAKDFWVIARFDEGYSNGEQVPKDFFVAGIRGLGTWGAAWYLDRKYASLRSLPETGDVQILVEVEVKDGMIASVRDVSNEPSSYFAQQISMRFIKSHIKNHARGGVVL